LTQAVRFGGDYATEAHRLCVPGGRFEGHRS
jgi:hypothetical protein